MTTTAGFVLDCSVALAWCFPDEYAPYPQSVLDSLATTAAAVPSLWFLEVANALLTGERRGPLHGRRCRHLAWLPCGIAHSHRPRDDGAGLVRHGASGSYLQPLRLRRLLP